MKNTNKSFHVPLILAFIFLVSSCTITIVHKYEDRYYESQRPVIVNPGGPDSLVVGNRGMLEVDHLGVGYDAVRVDPENLAENSVGNGSLSPPQVFEYVPSKDNFFTITYSRDKGKEEKVVPVGVIARQGERSFLWSNEARWARNASQYQSSFAHSYSGNIGVPGIASVSLSASFEDVKEVTKSSESSYVYKDGSFRGHILLLDMNTANPEMLSTPFKNAVAALGTEDASRYDAFIQNWGTHFSTENTMGAECYYRFTLTKSGYSTSEKSKKEFEQGVEVSLAKIGGGIGASQADEKASVAQNDMSAQESIFRSFGGSGESDNFSEWSKDAQYNPTVIDVRLASYLELFNKDFFPKDAQIGRKYQMLDAALSRYYGKNRHTETVNPDDFYKSEPRSYTVTVKRLYVKKGVNEDERHYGGILHLGVFDKLGNEKKKLLFMNLNGGHIWYLTRKKGGEEKYNRSFDITLNPEEFSNCFATIVGKMTETWHNPFGASGGTTSMEDKTANDTEDPLRMNEIIPLKDLEVGKIEQSKVTYTHKEGDIVEIYFEVKRTE